MQTFGKRLTLLRRHAGVSQEELAFGIRVSRQTVSNWENDKIRPLSENIFALCTFFNVKPEYFLSDGADQLAVKAEAVPEPEGGGKNEISITACTEIENAVTVSAAQPAENNITYHIEEAPKKKSRKKLFLAVLAVILSVAVLILAFLAYLYAPEYGYSDTASASMWNFDDITTILELLAGVIAFAVLCIVVYLIVGHFKNKKK